MKTSKLMLTIACAAAALVGCQKENVPEVQDQPINKSIVLNLANVMPATKGTGTTIADGTQVTLKTYQIFFADADGNFHTPKDKTAAADAETFFSFTAASPDVDPDVVKQFHFLPQSVTKVIVVGNASNSRLSVNTYDELMDEVQSLAIAEQQKPDSLVLYGMDASLTPMNPNAEDYNHENMNQDVHPEPLFKAEVNLYPAVARFEVTRFEYSQTPVAEGATAPARLFSKMTVENLSVIHWNQNATVALADDAITVTASGPDTYYNGFYNDDTMYPEYLVPVKKNLPEKGVWYFDTINKTEANEGLIPTDTYLLGAKNVTAAGTACWSYHVFPGALPRFIAELTGVNAVGSEEDKTAANITTKLYLQTTALGNLTDETVAAGNIYRMHFNFNDNDLRAAEKCIQVEITVAKWNVVAVTPSFGKNPGEENPGEETPGEETPAE